MLRRPSPLSFVLLLWAACLPVSGQAWTPVDIPTSETLRAIHFPSPNQGWAAGYNGTILHSSDGGQTWSAQSSGTSERFLSIRFLDNSIGWASTGRYIIRTVDGGSHWTSVGANPSPFRFRNALFPVSSTQAWVAVNSSGTPGLSRWFSRYTVQGNGSVTEEDFNVIGSPAQFLDLFFVTTSVGWSVGTPGQIIKITAANSGSPVFTPQPSNTNSRLNGIFMLDEQTGWIVGDSGTILKTTNGGMTWNPLSSGVATHLRGVFFLDADNGYACGDGGTILVTTDGGDSWSSEESGVSTTLWKIQFINPGFVVGGEFTGGQGVMLSLSTGPVASQRLVFPQFGDGGGFFSQIVLYPFEGLIPAQEGDSIQATISLRLADGNPMTVDLNGAEVMGQLPLEIPAGGVVNLRTDGMGTVQVGSVEVLSDRPLAGVVVFGGSFGLAGVPDSPVSDNGLIAPFESSMSEHIDTGIAVTTLEDEATEIRFELFDESGAPLGSAVVELPPHGQVPIYLFQLEWDPEVNFSELRGTVRLTSEGRIAATAIQSRPSQFAALPVTRP